MRNIKKTPYVIRNICQDIDKSKYDYVNLYFQDESRFGMKTQISRVVTAKGVKPIASFQEDFQSTYLHGFFSPIDGNSFIWEIAELSGEIFEILLKKLSEERPRELKIIILDNASFHTSDKITIPNDMILINTPPYTPELNAAERVWEEIKKYFKNIAFESMDIMKEYLYEKVREVVIPEKIMSLTGYDFYKNAFLGHNRL